MASGLLEPVERDFAVFIIVNDNFKRELVYRVCELQLFERAEYYLGVYLRA
jgi:hypothetical protein